MTASFVSAPVQPRRRSALGAIVIGVAGATASLALVLAGLVFFALAIAFPIAVPLATSLGAHVSVHDAELATRFAGFTWAFVGLSVAAFAAALGVLALTVRSIAPDERD